MNLRSTPRWIETLLWVALYAGIVAFVLTANASPPMYRAIFFDRTASDWVPGASRSYVPGTVIRGNALSPYFGRGWWTPEKEGRWGRGAENVIVIRPTVTIPAGSPVKASLGAMLAPGRPHQPVTVTLNGEALATLDFTGTMPSVNLAVVTTKALPAGQDAFLTIHVPGATSPYLAHAYSRDQREHGIGLATLSIGP